MWSMSAITIALIVFACVGTGAALGSFLRKPVASESSEP